MSTLTRVLSALPLVAAIAAFSSTASAQHRHQEEPDGVRFRGGISAGGGGIFLGDYGIGMGGITGRLGVQVNNLIGVYASPYISFGGGKVNGGTALTGTAGSTLNVDFTFIDQLFVGVGGGAGLIGSVGVPQVQLRVGGYPVMVHGHGARRKALMIGGDFSLHIVSGVVLMQPMFNVGYEAF